MAQREEGEGQERQNSDGSEMAEICSPPERKRSKKARERDKERRGREEEDREGEEGWEVRDPLMAFGSDILMIILGNLDARSVARSLLVSRGWRRVASSDRLWSPKCEELWRSKAHIPSISMVPGTSRLEAYSFSIMDSKRTRILMEDLCDHTWEFRFKKSAPPYWRNLDPSWKGTGPPMRRYFHPDGTQSADPTDKVWGGHECRYSLVTSFVDEGRIREHYVRINRWPRMAVSRKEDWSWELSNHLYCYSSIPDADKKGGTGPLYPLWQRHSHVKWNWHQHLKMRNEVAGVVSFLCSGFLKDLDSCAFFTCMNGVELSIHAIHKGTLVKGKGQKIPVGEHGPWIRVPCQNLKLW